MMDISLQIQRQESSLIAACVRKERWAQQVLYKEHYGYLMGICLRYARDEEEAMDILHEGFIKVFKHIAKYKPGTSLKAWLSRIMINTSIDFYRKKTRRRTESLDTVYDAKAGGPDAISDLSAQEILKCVQTLSPAYRTVFNLYVIEGYSHKEIAHKLSISESTSRSNLVKARLKLRLLLNNSRYE